MPPPRPATEARSGSLEPGRPSRARSANTRNPAPAGRTRRPPTGCTRQTSDVRQHHRLMPPGRGHNNKGECLFDTLTLRSTPHVMLWWILPSISTDELLASSLICMTFASVAIYTERFGAVDSQDVGSTVQCLRLEFRQFLYLFNGQCAGSIHDVSFRKSMIAHSNNISGPA